METKLVSLPIQGIQRNLPDYACAPGSCHEVINLRNKDGAWRPVGTKFSDEGMYIGDMADFSWIIRHPVLPEFYFVGEKLGYLHIIHDDTIEPYFLHYNHGASESVVCVDYNGYVLRIVTIYLGFYSTYLIKYDYDTSSYFQLKGINRPRVEFVNQEHENNPMTTESGVSTSLENAAGGYLKKMAEINEAGYTEGHTLFMLAYRMSDGTFAKYSQPFHLYLGGDPVANPLGPEQVTGYYRYRNVQAGKPKMKLCYYNTEKTDLAAYKGIIKSLCVFMCKPVSHFVPGTYNEAETLVLTNGAVKDLPESSLYYLVKEISLQSILDIPSDTGGTSVSGFFDIDLHGLDTLQTKELLPVDDFSNHSISGKCSFLFNERLHLGDTLTQLGPCSDQLVWHPDGAVQGQSAGTVLSSDAGNGTSLFFIVNIATDGGNRVTVFAPEFVSIYASPVGYLINSILAYPDDRATSIQLWFGGDRIKTWQLKRHSTLNIAYFDNFNAAANTFLDVQIPPNATPEGTDYPIGSDIIHDSNRVQVSSQNSIFSYPARNSYRVGPRDTVVLGFGTIGEPVSQGQFGTFPLYIFHGDGITTLEHGSGEVLYQSMQPVAKDVCNNPASILCLGGGVLFSTKTGLKIISGRQVQDISDPVEGAIPVYLHGVDSYVDVLSSDYLANLYPNLSGVNFREYLAGAILAYDHENKEIIVSNPSKVETWLEKYSYVFNLDSKTWHKISQCFTQFVNNYPGYLGVLDTKLHDMSREDETVYSHVLMQTRPVTLENKFSKIIRGRLCGYFHAAVNSFVSLYLFGSQDGRAFTLLGGTQAPGHEFLDIKLARSHVSCRYYIFVITGQLNGSDISHLEIEYIPTFDKKLR